MSLSKFQRATSWNVEVYSGSWRIAGVYQGADLLHVADIAHELDLCLVFDKPDDDAAAPWQPALLLRGTMPSSLIVLDRQDDSPFPTPTPDEIRHCYEYVFHSSECALREDPHSLEDTCIQRSGLSKRRFDPHYLEIGARSIDGRHVAFPTRSSSQTRSSASRATSPSPTRTDTTGADELSSIPYAEARSVMNAFARNVLQICDQGCVITGKSIYGGAAGPGLEAAHIVPQTQWNTYPINNNNEMADPDLVDQLELAWKCTWSAETNGVLMLSHLRECFDARLIAFHPKTHLIRAFIDYDVVTEVHGMHATLPRLIPEEVLQHHWDMCCLENTPSTMLIPSSGWLADMPEILKPKVRKMDHGDSDTAQQVIGEDKVLEETNDKEYGRGRSRKRKRCIATEENAEDDAHKQDQDGVQTTKRQGLE